MSKYTLKVSNVNEIVPTTFSKHQTILVEKFIAERGNLTLEAIDFVIVSTKQREKILSEKISNRNVAEGIDIGVINECKRMTMEKRTSTQQKLADLMTEKRAMENMLIDQYLNEELVELRTQISEWTQIRQIFIDIYPESKTSPRSSRAELEASPTRFSFVKSKSATSLNSPRIESPRLSKMKKETQ